MRNIITCTFLSKVVWVHRVKGCFCELRCCRCEILGIAIRSGCVKNSRLGCSDSILCSMFVEHCVYENSRMFYTSDKGNYDPRELSCDLQVEIYLTVTAALVLALCYRQVNAQLHPDCTEGQEHHTQNKLALLPM